MILEKFYKTFDFKKSFKKDKTTYMNYELFLKYANICVKFQKCLRTY